VTRLLGDAERRGAARALPWLLAIVALVAWPPEATVEDPAAEVTRALQALGAPGLLWGRVAVEEESPDGPWTPLAGVEVRLYPYVPGVAADLDRIRERARGSGTDYDAAVTRLLERLRGYEAQIAALRPAGGPAASDGGPVRKRTTDASGIFVFDEVPSGDWLVVAIHLSTYTQPKAQPRASKSPGRGPGGSFLTRPPAVAKEAELWVSRARVGAGERSRLWLTDRSRFMVGPVR